MSFRDISRQSGSSKSPPNRQLSEGGIAAKRTQKRIASKDNILHSSTGPAYPMQQSDSHQLYNTINGGQHLQLSQQREEDYALQAMREREQELLDINHKMNVVNEIYKDLGQVVDGQQEQIDGIENQFGVASSNAQRGLEWLEKANAKGRKKGIETKQDGEEGKETRRQDECQFFLLKYIQNKMSSIRKIVSVCGGSASTSYSLGENDR